MLSHSSEEALPFVSVIVPGKNCSTTLRSCLLSIFQQDYPNYEIIYVDGQSEDNSREIAAQLAASPDKIKILECNGAHMVGKNVGIKSALGEIAVLIDADCIAVPHWLSSLINPVINDSEIASVGGPNVTPPDDTRFAQIVGHLFSTYFGAAGSRYPASYRETRVVQDNPSCNVALRVQALRDVGLYDEAVNVDVELDYRLRKKGYKVLYVPDALVWHYRRSTPLAFARQMFKYGRNRAVVSRRFRQLLEWRHLVPPVFLVTLLAGVSSLLLGGPSLTQILSGAALIAYLIFGVITSLSVFVKSRDVIASSLILPLGFIEHVCYAAGFFFEFFRPLPQSRIPRLDSISSHNRASEAASRLKETKAVTSH